ncbi:MAG TPA: formylmethanofuran dehydrogenase subunit E family protein [Methanocorpusculum sp.]|nr:formylmethanofuran dehydrogenase subunit E family protein [Methanocorpusculum sp.]
MVQIPTFEIMTKAHWHMCPGIALGYKMAVVVGKWVGDEDNVKIIAHTTRCPLDALKITFDVKNHPERLIVDDTNTVSFIITKPNGCNLFIDELPGTHLTSEELTELKKKVQAGTATRDDRRRINEIKAELFHIMQSISNEKLFTVREE